LTLPDLAWARQAWTWLPWLVAGKQKKEEEKKEKIIKNLEEILKYY